MTKEELNACEEQVKALTSRYNELLALPAKEFLSEEVSKELQSIRKQMVDLARILLNSDKERLT